MFRKDSIVQSELFARSKNFHRFFTPAGFLFTACLLYFLGTVSIGWNNPLLDNQAFRQTQTAISTYYMIGRLPTLAYETPVLGPPWSIPFEFPLCQWLVAAVVTALGTPLDQTGRCVNLILFLLTLIPASQILAALKFSGQARLIILSLVLTSPFYIFWTRAFMIESTALFLGMAYLAAVVSMSRKEMLGWSVIPTLLLGILAALVKITTFVPFFLAALLFLGQNLIGLFRAGLFPQPFVSRFCLALLVTSLPVVALVWWTQFADSQKQLNPLGRYITSTALKDWNFGTLDQRCSTDTWVTILRRETAVFGNKFVGLGAFLGLILSRRRWREAFVCGFLFLSAPLIFTNLHYVHAYYAFANNIFLVAAVGACLAALLERGGWYAKAVPPGILLILLMGGLFYSQYYYPQQFSQRVEILEVCETIQRVTQIDDMIVILGCDWSPELPYYSRRRALMVPNWAPSSFNIWAYLPTLKNYGVGALIVHHSTNDPLDQDWVVKSDEQTAFTLKSKIRVDNHPQDGDRSYEFYEIFVGETDKSGARFGGDGKPARP